MAALTLCVAAILPGSVAPGAATERAETPVVPPLYRMLYLPGDADRRIDAAKTKLITECMAARGLTYVTHVEHVTERQVLDGLRPFGLETVEGVTTGPPPVESNHSEEYTRALFGDPNRRIVARGERLEVSWPANGCQADAEIHLLGDRRQRASELRLRLYDGERDAREQIEGDPLFTDANARWRECVRRAGVDAENPSALLSGLPENTDIATDPAIRADLRCKRATGYLDIAYARLAGLQQDWMDVNVDLVDEWLSLRRHQDTIAKQVLGPS